ncbi:sigma-70 family RNA polymerase sigma factor [Leptospira biflexa]|jgi:RNA polymerase sigma-70 factor (ECF subfamily)|uniref:Putative RNA polymerase ECF-type sigma factor n=1 Tax=Leptospira biflexa serovar Patoc (strain Patoc 1 / ATCC 23582 / Paris) TaxID=456481 RepID=B0STQ7_LEPBP|nr:sigma-70 family RNA polymerase sigma factor [Leptospira biflexa]ABZ95877.1 RNA polymerase sigma subunit [Leptospira biflexa serovar Patoc strain 'Patoc 1 (Ames)']ABZ99591.1 Putative RNA polymerase ECF-type sigma factor [Leptospira biflexa serovar Patoc strain 'Patoc 1 (Paris)']TGM32016.1 sigma-70 family RNA polymerase sigma factor [Leptospira biflexa]TGM39015.1 sigma-70 family RNA polymerase sigma factor [Leptospira biflexa]TGM42764.1 sigma-70 family RNA polymerase sigma factor [Leptospira 
MTSFDFETVVKETKYLVLKTIGDTLIDRFDDATEDVVQEVYFRVFKSLEKGGFDGRSKISTWIYTIAKNESLRMNEKRLREEEKAKRYLQKNKSDLFQTDENHSILKEDWINSLLQSIPEVYRQTLRLYLSGKSMEEISNELKIKQGTVKSRLFRTKEWIRKTLPGVKNEFQES